MNHAPLEESDFPWWLRRWPAIAVGVSTLAAGGGQLWLSRTLDDSQPWWASVLQNTGSETLLLAPLLLLTQIFGRTLRRNRQQTNQLVTNLRDEVDDVRRDVNSRIEEMRADVASRINQPALETEAMFERLASEPSRDLVRSVLRHATEQGLISELGLWTELPYTDLLIRWKLFGDFHDDELLAISLEVWDPLSGVDFARVATLGWHSNRSPTDIFVGLGQQLKELGRYPGDVAFDPAAMFPAMSSILIRGIRDAAGVGTIARPKPPILRDCGQWLVTERSVVTRGDREYSIELWRLKDMDWDRHVGGKSWVAIEEFRTATDFAELLIECSILEPERPTP